MDAWLERGKLEPCLPYFKELATLEKGAAEAASQKEHESRPLQGGIEGLG